jgi:DNA-binding NtrC family response regulator
MKSEGRTVLFVEDEPLLGELMVEALTEKGFEVQAVPDAGSALRYLLSGAEADVLFTDIDLGEGMDGVQLAQLVHEMRPKLPIVYASGRRSLDQFTPVPGSIFLPKPYSLNQVDQTLARIKGKA